MNKISAFIKEVGEEIDSYVDRDPAVRSAAEVFFTYPGFHALLWHRAAHWLYGRRWYFFARVVSAISRWLTGIEIHPGATIGRRLFIDHGTGVVIGETAEIGNDVTLYQGVTLGGTTLEKGKRHPTLEDGVIVGSGAQILGPFAVGKNARIGANSVVLREVPPCSTVIGVPGRVVKAGRLQDGECFDAYGTSAQDIDEAMPALEAELRDQVDLLKAKIEGLEIKLNDVSRAGKPPAKASTRPRKGKPASRNQRRKETRS